jgi:tRNA threonylcarbamoyladenosine biosynthesis protein TsaB
MLASGVERAVIVLGIDTSAYFNAVGLCEGNRVLADAAFDARTDSLEQIVDNIDSVLKGADLTLNDVTGIGVGLGPGSWTGIRVGVTVGKLLAFSTHKPVSGVTTLEALAFSVRDRARLICAVISVGAGDAVYAGLYQSADDGMTRQGDYYIGDVKGLAARITEPCIVVGEGAAYYAGIMGKESGLELKSSESRPGGAAVACLAARRLARGESDDTLALTPLYLKESTAKIFVNKYARS